MIESQLAGEAGAPDAGVDMPNSWNLPASSRRTADHPTTPRPSLFQTRAVRSERTPHAGGGEASAGARGPAGAREGSPDSSASPTARWAAQAPWSAGSPEKSVRPTWSPVKLFSTGDAGPEHEEVVLNPNTEAPLLSLDMSLAHKVPMIVSDRL